MSGLAAACLVGLASCGGCQLEKLQPGDVAMGVGRLTVRQAALVARLITIDDRCGFASAAVKGTALVQGQPGQRGAVTWTIESCELDFGDLHEVLHDCVDTRTSAKGKVTVSAKQRALGTVTGDRQNPIIPEDAESVSLEVHAAFDHFQLTRNTSKADLTTVAGSLDFEAAPHLAMNRTQGVCAIPTLDITFSKLKYAGASLVVNSGDRVFPVEVPTSDLGAQMGRWKDQENVFAGTVTVWDTDYTAKAYADSVACDETLATPLSYACPSLKEQLVLGASRLSVRMLATVAGLADADSRCGFASAAVLGAARLTGTAGGPGKAVLELASPCTLAFTARTTASKDCNGVEQYVQGTVEVTGTKTLSGVLTGDAAQPVVPSTRDPAALALVAHFTDFSTSDSTGAAALTASSGTLSGTVIPRLGLDAQTGICSKPTAAAEFQNLTWTDGQLLLGAGSFQFQVGLSTAALEAQSGTKGDRTNYLAGIAVSDGVPVVLPHAGTLPVLDPAYDAARFESGFTCGTFEPAPDDDACAFDHVLALNVARLLMQNLGAAATMVNGDDQCGFQNTFVLLSPTRVEGSTGSAGLLEWEVTGCRVGQSGVRLLGTDCGGTRTYSSGFAQVDASRVVQGERNTAYAIADSVIPRTPDAVSITLADSQVTDFAAYALAPGAASPTARLVLHDGHLAGKVVPVVGERTSNPGVFDVPTPVATFSEVRLSQANGTLEVGGMRFTVQVADSALQAQNGSLHGVSNTVSGSVTLGSGATVVLPPSPLNPTYSQAAFDQTYACTPDLKSTVPPN